MDLNNLIGDLLSQKMVFYGNMLGLGVEYSILGHADGTSVITMNWDWRNVFYLQVCKCLNHPKYLSATSSSNVLCLYS
jgi:hypothetical protein